MNYTADKHKASALCRILVGQTEERETIIKGFKSDPCNDGGGDDGGDDDDDDNNDNNNNDNNNNNNGKRMHGQLPRILDR